ncbi:MAG: hypothetical protein KJZ59_01935, partial [Pararhodobacter sp.]|nr:hypothetical protein [Pararhodobacter sp.]
VQGSVLDVIAERLLGTAAEDFPEIFALNWWRFAHPSCFPFPRILEHLHRKPDSRSGKNSPLA